MSVSIIACPSCKSLVLPDTAQCPNCNFVFDEKRASVEPVTAGRVEPTEEEIPCPGCNELVRKGLVRCWNCGTFMQSHIAETYKRMQISPPKVIYSETNESEQDAGAFSGSVSDSGRLIDDAPPPGAPADADEDFEMAGGMPDDPDEGDFDLGTAEPPSMPNEIVQSAPVFALKKEEDEEPKAAPKTGKGKKADKAAAAAAAEAATTAKRTPDSRPEFSNEFENRFGADDAVGTGEGLLRVALAEEAETGSRKRLQKVADAPAKSGFRVYCPNGHCIEVQERHRGRTGRCPRCRELYYVPGGSWDEEKALQEDEAKKAAAITAAVEADQNKGAGAQIEISAGEFTRWMLDSHFHSVDLTKLKLKSGSLLKDFQEADVGFAPDGILTVLLTKKGGLLGGGDKKKLAARDAVIHHLSEGKARQELPAAAHYFFPAAQVSQLRVVQPIVSAEQSMFAGVPVFGDGRIAIRLPKQDGTPNPQFLSFSLSEFRRFCKILEEFYALRGLGSDSGVPVEDVYSDRMCHFSNQPMRILEHVEFYKDDPGFKLKIIGYKCDGCGLVVSEESREKEQIGGKGAKKIAKAKCPKCKKPFGNLPQYSLDTAGAAS